MTPEGQVQSVRWRDLIEHSGGVGDGDLPGRGHGQLWGWTVSQVVGGSEELGFLPQPMFHAPRLSSHLLCQEVCSAN